MHVSATSKQFFRTAGGVQADIYIVITTPINRRTAMQATNRTCKILTALSVVLVTAALIGAAASHPAQEPSGASPTVAFAAPTPMVGTSTIANQDGVAVYRLPSIAVTVSRSEVLARLAREEKLVMK
jgi:hypothetical protein